MSALDPQLTKPLSSADRTAPHLASAAAPRALRMMLALEDFEAPARRYIPRPIFGYVSGGVERNVTLDWNRSVFDDLALVPRMLVNVSGRSPKTTLFGQTYDSPFGIAPMGGTSLAAFQGDLALALAAAAKNVPMILSGASLTPLEKVREAGGRHTWFQAYLPGDTTAITELVERVARAGYETLVLTVDIPVGANRASHFSNILHGGVRLKYLDTRDAEDLAAAHLEFEVRDGRCPPVVADREPRDRQPDGAGARGLLLDFEDHVAADHEGGPL